MTGYDTKRDAPYYLSQRTRIRSKINGRYRERAPTLIVELAKKGEDKKLFGMQHRRRMN